MDPQTYSVESHKLFSESLIWQINRDYYNQVGLEAWRSGVVPHHMTSNARVGKTYAQMIIGFLKDIVAQGAIEETIYIIELGAGHGRLGFHILKYLDHLTEALDLELPPYCYVLSDIVEADLEFYKNHPQLQDYFKQGKLDYAYFDAVQSQDIYLRYADKTIRKKDLQQPLIAIGNYFFDSIPNDIFHIKKDQISVCSVALESTLDPKNMDTSTTMKNIKISYEEELIDSSFYEDEDANKVLNDYRTHGLKTYLFFPKMGIQCLQNLSELSVKGMMVITMDKGFHELRHLDARTKPEVILHGSFSFWVNYHALGAYCHKKGGRSLFPSSSTFHMETACFLFLSDKEKFLNTIAAYELGVNDFGPDDINTLKKMAFANVKNLKLMDLIAVLRMSAYDSAVFLKFLPRLKEVSLSITNEERERLGQALHQVWHYYFNIGEPHDMAYTLGGMCYDLGYYPEALDYFKYSEKQYGHKVDTFYNRILSYYQLRQDKLFSATLTKAKTLFPNDAQIASLDKLDLAAV